MAPLLINEFLCFLSSNFDKLRRENLLTTLHDFYGFREASDAKNVLILECRNVSISDSIEEFTGKRVEGKSGALRRVITDTSTSGQSSTARRRVNLMFNSWRPILIVFPA